MATPATYDGLLALFTYEGVQSDSEFFTTAYVELFKIRNTTMTPVGVINLPNPSGCPYLFGIEIGFTHDESLIVNVNGSTGNTSATSLGNNNRGQLHKYKVTDDGDVQHIWGSTETPFLIPNHMGNLPVITRDGSWAAWCVDSVVDMGTGNVQFQSLHNPPFTDPSALDFNYQASYVDSPFADCLTRQSLDGKIYQAVNFSGDVIRSAKWQDYSLFYPQNLQFSDSDVTRPYQSDICYVVIGSHRTDGGRDVYYQRFDSDTYLPTTDAPAVNQRELDFRTFGMQRLPGGGFDSSLPSGIQAYVPVKTNSSGWLDAAHDPTAVTWDSVIDPNDITTVLASTPNQNGLGLNFSRLGLAFRNQVYGRWFDTDGNVGSIFGPAATTHQPPNAAFDFRPVLPSGVISGAIDSTRRLFTAV